MTASTPRDGPPPRHGLARLNSVYITGIDDHGATPSPYENLGRNLGPLVTGGSVWDMSRACAGEGTSGGDCVSSSQIGTGGDGGGGGNAAGNTSSDNSSGDGAGLWTVTESSKAK